MLTGIQQSILLQSAISLLLNGLARIGELLSNDLKVSIVRSFRKCSITIALDGSEDSDINIRGLEGYTAAPRAQKAKILVRILMMSMSLGSIMEMTMQWARET